MATNSSSSASGNMYRGAVSAAGCKLRTHLAMRTSPKAVEALGFRVHPGTVLDYVNVVEEQIKRRDQSYIFDHNLHSLYLYFRDPAFRALYRNALVKIDGMPVVWALRLAGIAVKRNHRVTWMDFVWPLLERANEQGWRVFWLGNTPQVSQTGLANIRRRYPQLTIGGHHGFFDQTPGSADNQRLVERINNFGADVCIVGMGMLRQERWIVQHRAHIDAPAMLIAGGCLEYIAGTVSTPPRWMGRWGLEWSYRFMGSPRRFAHRYLIEPWALLAMVLLYKLRAEKHLSLY